MSPWTGTLERPPSYIPQAMKPLATIATLLGIFALPLLASPEPRPLVFQTGPPALLEGYAPLNLPIYSEEQYSRIAKLPRKPASLGPQAGFGNNFWVGEKNLSWAVDRNAKGQWLIYLDLDADGDLAEEVPLRFAEEGGRPTAYFRTQVRETVNGREVTYPLEVKMSLGEETPRGGGAPRRVLVRQHHTIRKGTVQAGGKEITFGVLGILGLYDHRKSVVAFDLNGDGRLDLSGRQSAERYPLAERNVNLAGRSYEIRVDRYGSNLILVPLEQKLPDRIVLLPGHPAPDFTAVDLDGKTRRLSDYRGKVVLLDFWFDSCGPCVRDAPKLAAIHRRFRARGFEILGVNSVDKPEEVRKFMAEYGTNWPQILEGQEAPVHKLFRIEGRPAYYLLDRGGKIVSDDLHPGPDLIRELEKLLPDARLNS